MYMQPPIPQGPMTCPYCDSVLAQYGRDYKKCNKCPYETGGARGTVRGRFPSPQPQAEVCTENQATPRNPRKPYESALKRLIYAALLRKPLLNNMELCLLLDDEEHEPPKKMQTRERSFQSAYKDPAIGPRLMSAISKVRGDMRKDGLLPVRRTYR
jgi:hypothetical protein